MASIDALIEDGLAAYGRGELDRAVECWEQALALDPSNVLALSYVDYVRANSEHVERGRGLDEVASPYAIVAEPAGTATHTPAQVAQALRPWGQAAEDVVDGGWVLDEVAPQVARTPSPGLDLELGPRDVAARSRTITPVTPARTRSGTQPRPAASVRPSMPRLPTPSVRDPFAELDPLAVPDIDLRPTQALPPGTPRSAIDRAAASAVGGPAAALARGRDEDPGFVEPVTAERTPPLGFIRRRVAPPNLGLSLHTPSAPPDNDVTTERPPSRPEPPPAPLDFDAFELGPPLGEFVEPATAPTLELDDDRIGRARGAAASPRMTSATAELPTARPARRSDDAVIARVLDDVDAGAPAAESVDEQHRRRLPRLIDLCRRATQAGRAEDAAVAAELAYAEAPEAAYAQKQLQEHREALAHAFVSYLGDLSVAPVPRLSLTDLRSIDLDNRAAFLLSRIDGTIAYEEILDIAGMPRIDALRYLTQLRRRGVLSA